MMIQDVSQWVRIAKQSVLIVFIVCFASACSADGPKQVSIHDPVMIKDKGRYYLFSTGPGITFYSSGDMKSWVLEGRVFADAPTWALKEVSGFNGHIWAPDIAFHNGEFYLYYSISSFGKNDSAIGLVTNKTLNTESADYQWVDHGMVLRSVPHRDSWNAIDPNIIVDDKGTPWMSFGSFWGGLKLVKLSEDWKSLAEPQQWFSIAKRERSSLLDDALPGPAEIEAPFIFKKNGYYYQFVSWGRCCLGVKSTYKLMVGRSKDVEGPYLDKDGKDLAQGGGSLFLAGNARWSGLGHNSVYTFDAKDYLVLHAYEASDNGLQKLKIMEMSWEGGWPLVDEKELDRYVSVLNKK